MYSIRQLKSEVFLEKQITKISGHILQVLILVASSGSRVIVYTQSFSTMRHIILLPSLQAYESFFPYNQHRVLGM